MSRLSGALTILFILLTAPSVLHAQEQSAEKMLSFADHLYDNGDYYRAITEYERFIFFYPGHVLSKQAKFQIGMCYLKGEKFSQAVQRFRALSNEYPGDEIGRKALFMLAESYYQKKDYSLAIDVLLRFLDTYPQDSQADAARIKLGWAYLRKGDWRQAQDAFQGLPQDSPLHMQAEGLSKETGRYPDIPKKSPYLAGGLSAVLPGAGQLYVGRPMDAAASFLLNGLFIWATVDAFKKDNNVTGGILLFFESGWYLGNVYNAVSSAHKYNKKAEQDFLDGLQGQYGLSLIQDENGQRFLALSFRF